MSDEIVFHHNPQSRAQIAHWMLEGADAFPAARRAVGG